MGLEPSRPSSITEASLAKGMRRQKNSLRSFCCVLNSSAVLFRYALRYVGILRCAQDKHSFLLNLGHADDWREARVRGILF
jgi:hypothetical protein